jgi:hypothetical protein
MIYDLKRRSAVSMRAALTSRAIVAGCAALTGLLTGSSASADPLITHIGFTLKDDDNLGQTETDASLNTEVRDAFTAACGARLTSPVRFNQSVYERPELAGDSIVSMVLYIKRRPGNHVVYAFHREEYTALRAGGASTQDLQYDIVPTSALLMEVRRLVTQVAAEVCGAEGRGG